MPECITTLLTPSNFRKKEWALLFMLRMLPLPASAIRSSTYSSLMIMSDHIILVFGSSLLIPSKFSLTLLLISHVPLLNISLVHKCKMTVVRNGSFRNNLVSLFSNPAHLPPLTYRHITTPPPCNWVLFYRASDYGISNYPSTNPVCK